MSSFDPQFAYNVLLPLAEDAYLADHTSSQFQLPAGYSVIGQIMIDPPTLVAMIAKASIKNQAFLAKVQAAGNSFGWVLQNQAAKTAVVTFRGTADLHDWLDDFDFLPEPYVPVANYGTVHQGFQSVYLSIAASVKGLLKTANFNFSRLILTGHSLGAALSELAAPDILVNSGFGIAPEVQNFAGPRAGHADFANVFDVRIDACFRVVNIWDIVPHVPPPLALFEHVGMAVKVDGGFTLDELVAHSLAQSYGPGLQKLIPVAGAAARTIMAPNTATAGFPNQILVGREP
ncbi:MAG: lipase family protein [Candidatus Acidiferrales bacterium]